MQHILASASLTLFIWPRLTTNHTLEKNLYTKYNRFPVLTLYSQQNSYINACYNIRKNFSKGFQNDLYLSAKGLKIHQRMHTKWMTLVLWARAICTQHIVLCWLTFVPYYFEIHAKNIMLWTRHENGTYGRPDGQCKCYMPPFKGRGHNNSIDVKSSVLSLKSLRNVSLKDEYLRIIKCFKFDVVIGYTVCCK